MNPELKYPAIVHPTLVQHLNRHFDNSLQKVSVPVTRSELLKLLSVQILQLLHQSPERVAQALYRVDVKEEYVKAAFGLREAAAVARRLAELVVEREEEKATFRERFSSPV